MIRILSFLSIFALVLAAVNLQGQHSIQLSHGNQGYKLILQDGYSVMTSVPASDSLDISIAAENELGAAPDGIAGPAWKLKFSASGKVFKDVSFANTQVGYIVTELGSVYKSTTGGDTWTSVMNLGFPYYWYGVDALSPDTVVIAGFNNQGAITEGVVRWTFDGGTTWEPEIILGIPESAVGWLERIHFFNNDTGIVINSFSGGCWITENGGKDADSWTYVNINPDLSWFAGNVDAQASGDVYAAGYHFAHSPDFGSGWTSGPTADEVFDGGVDFLDNDNMFGWTGGGQISAPVSGWIHRTTDGGASWSQRLMTFDYPIRALHFLDESRGYAAGGNLYDEAGGIYYTSDGGEHWNLDISTSAEMFSMEFQEVSADSIDIWCVGSTGGGTGYKGKLYKIRIGTTLTAVENPVMDATKNLLMIRNIPNPFSDEISVTVESPSESPVRIQFYDLTGRLVESFTGVEPYTTTKAGTSLKPGVYMLRVSQDERIQTVKIVKSR